MVESSRGCSYQVGIGNLSIFSGHWRTEFKKCPKSLRYLQNLDGAIRFLDFFSEELHQNPWNIFKKKSADS